MALSSVKKDKLKFLFFFLTINLTTGPCPGALAFNNIIPFTNKVTIDRLRI